jgi:hypothetical protein
MTIRSSSDSAAPADPAMSSAYDGHGNAVIEPAEVPVSTSGPNCSAGTSIRPRVSVEQLLAAKNTRPIRSLDDLAADTFESDEELEEFLAFTYPERHRDLA